MALSPIDIYRDVLPQTNCGDCGYATCLDIESIMFLSEQICDLLCENAGN